MKTFKDLSAFEKRLEKGIAWEDYFSLGGKAFNIYEYGGGSMFGMDHDYVYFQNKRSGDMVYIKYDCPSFQYIKGKKVQTKEYKFISLEYLEDAFAWR